MEQYGIRPRLPQELGQNDLSAGRLTPLKIREGIVEFRIQIVVRLHSIQSSSGEFPKSVEVVLLAARRKVGAGGGPLAKSRTRSTSAATAANATFCSA
jgi:hypothetical protein